MTHAWTPIAACHLTPGKYIVQLGNGAVFRKEWTGEKWLHCNAPANSPAHVLNAELGPIPDAPSVAKSQSGDTRTLSMFGGGQ